MCHLGKSLPFLRMIQCHSPASRLRGSNYDKILIYLSIETGLALVFCNLIAALTVIHRLNVAVVAGSQTDVAK